MPSLTPHVAAEPRQAPPAAAPRGRRDNPWLTLIAVAFGLFMVGLDGSVVSIANPEIGRDLNAGTADLQWVTNSYLLALAAALILGGKLGDRFGRRTFYLIGVAGFTVASVAIGLAGSIEGVIAFRAVQGFFGALLMPNTLALLRAVFPPRKFGMAVGIWGMVSSVSTALGPIVGGLLVQHVDWESVFYINAPIGVAALVFSALVLPQSKNSAAARDKFDLAGVVLLAAGLLAVVFGVVKGETWGWTSTGTLGAIAAGVVILLVFGWYETRVAHPLLPMRLFCNPALTVGTVVTALNFFVLLGVIFFVMLYLQNVRGYSPVEAGVRTLPLSLASVVASPLGAQLTERFGPRLTMPLGMVLQAAAAVTMLTWSADSSYATMWPPFFALGLPGPGRRRRGRPAGHRPPDRRRAGHLRARLPHQRPRRRHAPRGPDRRGRPRAPRPGARRGQGRRRDGCRTGLRGHAGPRGPRGRRRQPHRLHERCAHRRPGHRRPHRHRRGDRGARRTRHTLRRRGNPGSGGLTRQSSRDGVRTATADRSRGARVAVTRPAPTALMPASAAPPRG
jgi:EmrB/QacA subfamily drug resistance transporter